MLTTLGQPLRREILEEMSDGKPASPCEVAERLGAPLSNVSYHMRVLANGGALKPAGTGRTGGAIKRCYRRIRLLRWARMLLGGRSD